MKNNDLLQDILTRLQQLYGTSVYRYRNSIIFPYSYINSTNTHTEVNLYIILKKNNIRFHFGSAFNKFFTYNYLLSVPIYLDSQSRDDILKFHINKMISIIHS